jgi:NAD-dependent protein deacetylases, SIR2 family
MSDNIFRDIAELILKSNMTVVLTGAGISTESGIPDFRSPDSGLWNRIDPMEALSTEVLYNKPVEFYKTGFKILTSMKGAKPNNAHLTLTKLENEGLIDCIITQNIDNLHYNAGSRNIMEVHGHIRTGHCIKCGRVYGFDEIENKVNSGVIPPLCTCGGMIRPDVVFFGDNLPDCFTKAWEKSSKCDLMIIVGSSLQVGPVNYLPGLAKKLVIINMGNTMYDSKADIVCREKASHALERIYSEIQEIRKERNDK